MSGSELAPRTLQEHGSIIDRAAAAELVQRARRGDLQARSIIASISVAARHGSRSASASLSRIMRQIGKHPIVPVQVRLKDRRFVVTPIVSGRPRTGHAPRRGRRSRRVRRVVSRARAGPDGDPAPQVRQPRSSATRARAEGATRTFHVYRCRLAEVVFEPEGETRRGIADFADASVGRCSPPALLKARRRQASGLSDRALASAIRMARVGGHSCGVG